MAKEIIVQTRLGNNIKNTQYFEIAPHERAGFEYLRKKYYMATFRGEPTPVYNCHGMTFASRRTGIDESEELWKIIADDNYILLPEEEVLPGDVVLYIDAKGSIEHSGIVVWVPETRSFLKPLICSKWGSYKEAIHSVFDCPYDKLNIRYYRVKE
jgi:hypothetical protein